MRFWLFLGLSLSCGPGEPAGTDAGSGSSVSGETSTGGSTGDAPTTGAAASTGSEPTSACGRLEASRLPGDQRYCTCATEAGTYPDANACLVSLKSDNAEWLDCMCAIELAEPMYAKYIDCLAEAELGYGTCTTPLSCMEILGLGEQEAQCFDTYLAANAVCYKISKEAVLAEEACYDGSPPFMCGSGEPIPFIYLCDGVADCPDMSDEAEDLCQPVGPRRELRNAKAIHQDRKRGSLLGGA